MILIIRGGTPKSASTTHNSTRLTESYAFARSMKQISSEVLLAHPSSYSLRTSNIVPVVEDCGRKPHCSSEIIPAFSQTSSNQLATILRRTLSACATRERPLQLPHLVRSFFLCRTLMVASFHSYGISPVIHKATMMPWNASKLSWELSENPTLSSSTGSSSDSLSSPIALPLTIYHSACFVSFISGGCPSDRATGFGDRPSIIIRSRVAMVVLSMEAKYRLHLARISSSFRRSFQSSSLIHCALPTFLPCNFLPPLGCPHQPFMPPALVNSPRSQAYTSRYLSSAACMTSLRFLHAFCNARKAEPPSKPPRIAVQAFFPLRSDFF